MCTDTIKYPVYLFIWSLLLVSLSVIRSCSYVFCLPNLDLVLGTTKYVYRDLFKYPVYMGFQSLLLVSLSVIS